MLLSQNWQISKGDADVFVKRWGKKQKDVLDKMKPKLVRLPPKDMPKINREDLERLGSFCGICV
jgi:hypothetical protein